MRTVDEIFQLLDAGTNVKAVRAETINLIEHHIHSFGKDIGYWEKACLAHAIASLAWNIHSRNQPTTAWLRLCLVDIHKALVPVGERNENYTPKDNQLDALTHEQLLEAVNVLRADG